jgi:hypothetical protein
MCTKTNTTLLTWVFWLAYHRFIIIIKQTYSYPNAQLMTSIKWGAINSEVNSKVYIGSYQEFRFNNWSCFIVTRIIINIYLLSRSMIQFILTIQIFILFLMHMENYPLTRLKSEQNSKADTERNPTNIPQLEYQDYLNTKGNILKNNSKRTYNLFNPLN